ncbi:MAG: GTP-binding protein [Bryobacteraceae bacterium]|nr:MAG: GTP-binding protein [Bryobacteraceae bacterium]
MPANLGPDYLAAEEEFRRAETVPERIAALEKMYAVLPKHKGTEKLQADIRRKLSQLRKENQKKGPARGTPFYLIQKEGIGQIALLGPPNSGKSSLLRAMTNAEPDVEPFPFTTHAPTPGMAQFEDVQFQLIDLPPLAPEWVEPWVAQVLRRADRTLLVVAADDPDDLAEIDFLEHQLEEWKLARPQLMVVNKIDQPGGADNFGVLAELYEGRYECLPVSAETGEGLDRLARRCFELLDVVRVYTKAPGKKPDLTAPYVLKRGSTVLDAARHVHKDFAERLKLARLYRRDRLEDGLPVSRDHVVEDGDILEFHA